MAICITAGTRPKWGSRYRSRHRRCQCGALSHCHLNRARFYTASANSGRLYPAPMNSKDYSIVRKCLRSLRALFAAAPLQSRDTHRVVQ